jgi:hypothetical protein
MSDPLEVAFSVSTSTYTRMHSREGRQLYKVHKLRKCREYDIILRHIIPIKRPNVEKRRLRFPQI